MVCRQQMGTWEHVLPLFVPGYMVLFLTCCDIVPNTVMRVHAANCSPTFPPFDAPNESQRVFLLSRGYMRVPVYPPYLVAKGTSMQTPSPTCHSQNLIDVAVGTPRMWQSHSLFFTCHIQNLIDVAVGTPRMWQSQSLFFTSQRSMPIFHQNRRSFLVCALRKVVFLAPSRGHIHPHLWT